MMEFVILVDEKLNWHTVDPTRVMGFLALLSCYLRWGITPIFIFQGVAPGSEELGEKKRVFVFNVC